MIFFFHISEKQSEKNIERIIIFLKQSKIKYAGSNLLFNLSPDKIEKLTFHKKNIIFTPLRKFNICMPVVSTQPVPSCIFY